MLFILWFGYVISLLLWEKYKKGHTGLERLIFGISLAVAVVLTITSLIVIPPDWSYLDIALIEGVIIPILGLLAIALFLPALVYLSEYVREMPWFRELFIEGKGAAQKLAGPYTYSLYPSEFDNDKITSNIYLGHSRFVHNIKVRPVLADDDVHLLTVGKTGSGKTHTSIWPTLGTYKGSMIVIDPKGEHANNWYRRRAQINNGNVFYLDPFDLIKGSGTENHSYNVLSEINIEEDDGRTLLSALSSALIVPSGSGGGSGNHKFWEESGRMVLDGAIAHVLSTEPPENRTLSVVAERLIGKASSDGFADPERVKRLRAEMQTNSAGGGLPQQAAMIMEQAGERTYGIITIELARAFKWATDPRISKHIGKSDFKFSDLEHNPATIFIAMKMKDVKEQARWLRSITNLSMAILGGFNKKPNIPTLMVLDELNLYGQDLQELSTGYVTLRSAGVKLWVFLQTYAQIGKCFGAGNVADFESSSTIQAYGIDDNETARWLSEKLGSHVFSEKKGPIGKRQLQSHVAPIFDASEITTKFQKNTPLSLVFPNYGFPMLLERRTATDIPIDGKKFNTLGLQKYQSSF